MRNYALVHWNIEASTASSLITADFSDLQQNVTGLLSSELDKDDRCADRIKIENVTLTSLDPASLAGVQLHDERWACAKGFGTRSQEANWRQCRDSDEPHPKVDNPSANSSPTPTF